MIQSVCQSHVEDKSRGCSLSLQSPVLVLEGVVAVSGTELINIVPCLYIKMRSVIQTMWHREEE
jgi:hypothetical protein